MRSLTYFVAATLDSFIAAPDGQFDFFPFSDEYAEVVVRDYPETLPTHIRQALGVTAEGTRFDTVISGFATYDVGPQTGYPSPYSHLIQYVVSSRLTEPLHPDIRVVSSDPLTAVRDLKAGPSTKGIYLCGGGKLASALVSEIDELIIKRSPIVIGAGIPMFDGGVPLQEFAPMHSETIDIGVSFQTYRKVVIGPIARAGPT
jgi:dihydrofolate reductase